MRCIRLAVAVTFAVMSFAAVLSAQDAVAKELMKLEEQWASLYAKHDAVAIGKFISDDFLAITDKGVPFTKAQMLKGIGADTTHFVSATNKKMQVKVHGNTAIIIGVATEVTKGAKGNVTALVGWTDTWIRQADGKWLCVASQSLPLK